jgi:transposase
MKKNEKNPAQDWREIRRMRAWELKQKGWKQAAIAEALGVSKGAVSQWMRQAREGGVEALRHRKGGGPKPRLSEAQLHKLPAILAQGAEAFGFRGEVWTRRRVAAVIKRVFGVSYSLTHVGRLVAQIGWSLQKPIQRASQRDEVAIERWRDESWRDLQKKPAEKSAP